VRGGECADAAAAAEQRAEQLEAQLTVALASVGRLSSASRQDAAARIEEAERGRAAAEAALAGARISRQTLLDGAAAARRSAKACDAARAEARRLEQQVTALREEEASDDDESEGDEGEGTQGHELLCTRREGKGKGGRSWHWRTDVLIMELLSAGVQPSAIPAAMYSSASAFLDSMEGNSVPSVPYCSYENRQPLRPPTIKKGVRLERLCWYNYTEPDAEGDEGGSMWRSLARQNTSLPSALPCSLTSHRLLPLGRCSCTVIETEGVRKGPRSFYKQGEAVLVRWCAAPPHETSHTVR